MLCWNCSSFYFSGFPCLCSGTTTTTRPTASATLTTGATQPTNSLLDLWPLLDSYSSQLFSDDLQSLMLGGHQILSILVCEAFYTKSLPLDGQCNIKWYICNQFIALLNCPLAMANAICLQSLPWNVAAEKENIPSHLFLLDGILHHSSTNEKKKMLFYIFTWRSA